MATKDALAFRPQALPVAGRSTRDFTDQVSAALWTTSAVVGVSTLLDVGVLWILQRQATVQWEFLAVSNTLDAVPAIVLSLGLAYGGLHLKRTASVGWYVILSLLMLLVGIGSGFLSLLLAMDFLALAGMASQSQSDPLMSVALKGVLVGLASTVLLMVCGISGLVRSTRGGS